MKSTSRLVLILVALVVAFAARHRLQRRERVRSGRPVRTPVATAVAGAWSIETTPAPAAGTYTARAGQDDLAGNTDHSASHTFTITGGSGGGGGGGAGAASASSGAKASAKLTFSSRRQSAGEARGLGRLPLP